MINRIQKLKAKKGFTLVELIVVIAIIAILTAVIVPLVGRYSAQARYNTLMDGAKTVSNSAASAASDANQIGAVNDVVITGTRTNGDLTITLSGGMSLGQNDNYKADTASTDSAALRLAKSLYSSLKNALTDGSSFYVKLDKSDVYGVIYSADPNNTISAEVTDFDIVGGFDNAYTMKKDGSDYAVGLAGNYIPKAGGAQESKAPESNNG